MIGHLNRVWTSQWRALTRVLKLTLRIDREKNFYQKPFVPEIRDTIGNRADRCGVSSATSRRARLSENSHLALGNRERAQSLVRKPAHGSGERIDVENELIPTISPVDGTYR